MNTYNLATKDALSPSAPHERKPVSVKWYRTPLQRDVMKAVHERSDAKAFAQTLGYLSVLVIPGAAAMYGVGRWPAAIVIGCIFLYGMVLAFSINAMHELGHGTVFKTKLWNEVFVRVVSFFGWMNFEAFHASHQRHHRYTLHPPDDLEVVLPLRVLMKHFFLQGFVNPTRILDALKETIRFARGNFRGEWELTLYPESQPELRKPAINWARGMLLGHALIIAVSIYFQLWLLPVLTTFGICYGSWLFFLCNNTQHIGLQDNVPDFRLCCRTFTLSAPIRFLYWHMNYHIEHHMYAAVPCYNLKKLHEAIKYDLAPCPHGIIATWREIAAIQRRQEADPTYQYVPPLPSHGVVA